MDPQLDGEGFPVTLLETSLCPKGMLRAGRCWSFSSREQSAGEIGARVDPENTAPPALSARDIT